jgi:anti-sigma factor RsiW
VNPPLTCRQFIEFLDEYLAGSQPQHLRAEFERHLDRCRQCADYLHTYRETVKLGKAAFQHDLNAPVSASVPEELIHAVLVLTSRRHSRHPADFRRPH